MSEIANGNFEIKQRIELLKLFCIHSGVELIDIEEDAPFVIFRLNFDGKDVVLTCLLKNIVNSGWSNKPHIKRIQIPAIKRNFVHRNDAKHLSVLVGFATVDTTPVISVWNPFRYMFHDKNRSAYLTVNILEETISKGLYSTFYAKKDLLLCTSKNFLLLLREYIKNNAYED